MTAARERMAAAATGSPLCVCVCSRMGAGRCDAAKGFESPENYWNL